MKRTIILAAISILAAASCTKQEPVFVHYGNDLLSFSVAATKAADITTANLQNFNVTALLNGAQSIYFSNTEFSKNYNGAFQSPDPIYWPGEEALDFYAYAPCNGSNGQITATNYKTFSVVPDAASSSNVQADLVFATSLNTAKPDGNNVPLTFRHAESKIRVLVKNTSSTLKMNVEGWKIGHIAGSGEYSFTGYDDAGFCKSSDWTVAASANAEYVQNLTAANTIYVAPKDLTPVKVANELILVPQTQAKATTNAGADGSYIAVKLRIFNAEDGYQLVGNGTSGVWCIWPVDIEWTPGRSYTYVIDLAKSPVLGDDIIGFVDVIVRDWDEGDNGNLGHRLAEIPDYVEIDGIKWSTENLAITNSGKALYNKTGHVIGDYFQWGAYLGYCGNETDADKGLLIYDSFTSALCGGNTDAFSFKKKPGSEERYSFSSYWNDKIKSPYAVNGAYTKYTSEGAVLEPEDDAATICLGPDWHTPTLEEYNSLKNATYIGWDQTDKGYYVFLPKTPSDAGKIGNSIGTYDKKDALLFFPEIGYGVQDRLDFVGQKSMSVYATADIYKSDIESATFVSIYSGYTGGAGIKRSCGCAVRPVSTK